MELRRLGSSDLATSPEQVRANASVDWHLSPDELDSIPRVEGPGVHPGRPRPRQPDALRARTAVRPKSYGFLPWPFLVPWTFDPADVMVSVTLKLLLPRVGVPGGMLLQTLVSRNAIVHGFEPKTAPPCRSL